MKVAVQEAIPDLQGEDRAFPSIDRFVAVVAHELRSPLNGIQSWSHVLEGQLPDGPPLLRRALEGIRTGVEQQVRLLEKLSDAARILGPEPQLTLRELVLRPVLEDALADLKAKAEPLAAAAAGTRATLGPSLVSEVRIGTESVRADATWLRQMFGLMFGLLFDLLVADAAEAGSTAGRAPVLRVVADVLAGPAATVGAARSGGPARPVAGAVARVIARAPARRSIAGRDGPGRIGLAGLEWAVLERLARLHGGSVSESQEVGKVESGPDRSREMQVVQVVLILPLAA